MAQLTDQDLSVAAFAKLDDESSHGAVEQRLNHLMEALGADLAGAGLPSKISAGTCPVATSGDDLPPAAVALVDEVPAALARQAEGSDPCRSRAEIGIPATPDESFILDDDDTIVTVQRAHREACTASRRATAALQLDDMVYGNRRGPLPRR